MRVQEGAWDQGAGVAGPAGTNPVIIPYLTFYVVNECNFSI